MSRKRVTPSTLLSEAREFIEFDQFEDAVQKLRQGLDLNPTPSEHLALLDQLGYCFLRLGWHEDAAEIYKQLLAINPEDNDSRFFLATVYGSLKWTDDAIRELRLVLAADPTDILSRHELALCFRDKGWVQESLEEMRVAKRNADLYGDANEIEVVAKSLKDLEHEIEMGEDGERGDLLAALMVLLLMRGRKKKHA